LKLAKQTGMKVLLKIKNPTTGAVLAGQKGATLSRKIQQ
jgi:hypothetical protein